MAVNPMRHRSHVLTAVGAATLAVSAFTPWFVARRGASSFSMTPAMTDVLQPAVWMLLAILIGGVVLFLVRSAPAAIGAVGAMWLCWSAAFWLLASRLSWMTWVIPDRVLPDAVSVRLGLGASLGMVGSALAVAGTVGVLTEQTCSRGPSPAPRWIVPTALLLGGAAVAVRELGWVEVASESGGRWLFDLDALPFAGDALSVASFITITLLALTVLRPRMWVAWALGGAAGLVALLAALVVLSGSVVENLGDELIHRTGLSDFDEATVATTSGPLAWLALSAVTIGFAYATGRSSGNRKPAAAPPSTSTHPLPHVATDPPVAPAGREPRPGIADDGLPSL